MVFIVVFFSPIRAERADRVGVFWVINDCLVARGCACLSDCLWECARVLSFICSPPRREWKRTPRHGVWCTGSFWRHTVKFYIFLNAEPATGNSWYSCQVQQWFFFLVSIKYTLLMRLLSYLHYHLSSSPAFNELCAASHKLNSCALLVLAISGKDHWTMLSVLFVQSRIKINGKTVYVAILRTQNAAVPHPLGVAN